MLFIPLFGDQLRNALKSVATGNALILPFSEVTSQSFLTKITDMLSNKAYTDRANELERLFNDNLVHPMAEAMFWIEYVIRSKGAKHLKSNAVNMSLFSYLLLDILFIPVAVILTIYILIRKLIRREKPSNDQSLNTTNKKKKQ